MSTTWIPYQSMSSVSPPDGTQSPQTFVGEPILASLCLRVHRLRVNLYFSSIAMHVFLK